MQPWRPGLNVYRAADVAAWRPCLTRARGENDQPLATEHAWFLDVGGTGYCWTCRESRPRAVFGPEDWIAEIRAALEVGELRLARELVRRGPEVRPEPGAKVDDQVRGPAVVGGRNAAPGVTAGETAPVDASGVSGHWERRRADVFDTEAVDPVLAQAWFGTSAAEWDEFIAERAAIFEYLGGHPRPVAEVKARQLGGARPREGARK